MRIWRSRKMALLLILIMTAMTVMQGMAALGDAPVYGTSARGVVPTPHEGNITDDQQNPTSEWKMFDGVKFRSLDGTSVEWVAVSKYPAHIYMKGGDKYNDYDYTSVKYSDDQGLLCPLNNGGQTPGISHIVIVTGDPTPLKGSLTINKIFSDQSTNSVSFELYKGTNLEDTQSTSGGTAKFEDLDLDVEYLVKEVVPEGYTSSLPVDGQAFTLTEGERTQHLVWNVTNTLDVGSLEITKIIQPYEYDQVARIMMPLYTFTVKVTGPSYPAPEGITHEFHSTDTWLLENLIPGQYIVTEPDSPGWTEVIETSPVTVVKDKTALVTVTNTEVRGRGALEVTKTIDYGDFGKATEPYNFMVTITGPSYPLGSAHEFTYNGETFTWNDLLPGDYKITENDSVEWIETVPEEDVPVVAGQTAKAGVKNVFDYKTTTTTTTTTTTGDNTTTTTRDRTRRDRTTRTTATTEEPTTTINIIETAPPLAVPQVFTEEVVPLAVPVLPKTGELPISLFYGLGGVITAIGLYLKRK